MPCKTLYVICLEYCIPRIESYSRKNLGFEVQSSNSLENLAAPIIEDLLTHAFHLANDRSKSIQKVWKEEWKIFFTSKITFAVLFWDSDLINHISTTCKNLKKCEVVSVKNFDADLILKMPNSVTVLDFDGELIHRGKVPKESELAGTTTESWLPHAQKILRSLLIFRTSPSDYPSTTSCSLAELHLGTVHATSSDLKAIIKNSPNLRLLRHYQMVTALYELHSEAWKKKKAFPKYKLKNLDVDFSHVVRCRMSPEWVLSPDALQLAVALCPSATSIRVRFDCSTPHDVLSPLMSLSKIKEFSAVCVSSGERTLLDFSDMSPILEKFGPHSLQYLELKVIEEVEIHEIIEYCTKAETLILSGCGYVTPPTCSTFSCQTYEKGSFKKLKFLFYADGDDFSWDHGVPECFWKAALYPFGTNRLSRLQGLFLEFPRMSSGLIKDIFQPSAKNKGIPFPELQALSFCRFEEITVEEIAFICGVLPTGETSPGRNLKYIRLSDCEKIDESGGKRLKKWLNHAGLNTLRVDVDR